MTNHRHAAPRRRRVPRPVKLVMALLVVALVLGGGYWWLRDDDPAIVSGAGGGSDVLPTTAWSRAKPESVKAGGRLRLAVTAMPGNFNPEQADGAGATTNQVLRPTTGGPVRITTDGGWRVDPDYARSVDVLDRRPLTVRVRLNPDAVWQDGTPITTKDMVAFHSAMSGEVDGLEVVSTDGYDDVDSIERGDRFEYTVTFGTPRSDWPRYIYPRLPADVSSKPKSFNNAFRKKAIPSNGPFVVTSIDAKTGTITEKRNPRWWGRKPQARAGGVAHRRPRCAGQGLRGRRARRRVPGRLHVRGGGRLRHGAGGRWSRVVAPHTQRRPRAARRRECAPRGGSRDRPEGTRHRGRAQGRCAGPHGRQRGARAGAARIP